VWSELVPGEITQELGQTFPPWQGRNSQALFVCIVSLRKLTSTVFKVVSIILKKGPEKNFLLQKFF